MSEFEPSDPGKYITFESFITRKHKAGARPIYEENNSLSAVAVADSRMVVYDTVSATCKLCIKGQSFTISQLLMDTTVAGEFEDAAVAIFRLSPQDYHRYHSPVYGSVTDYRSLPEEYFAAESLVRKLKVDIMMRNARSWIRIETEEFGTVIIVAVGSSDVKSVQFDKKWQRPGGKIRKGQEVGVFQVGASSVIVLFQKGRVRFDKDLSSMSLLHIQTDVEVGMTLGKATKPSSFRNWYNTGYSEKVSNSPIVTHCQGVIEKPPSKISDRFIHLN